MLKGLKPFLLVLIYRTPHFSGAKKYRKLFSSYTTHVKREVKGERYA